MGAETERVGERERERKLLYGTACIVNGGDCYLNWVVREIILLHAFVRNLQHSIR